MTREQLIAAYLDWKNNYLSVEHYAEVNGLNLDEAAALINLLRSIFDRPHPEE